MTKKNTTVLKLHQKSHPEQSPLLERVQDIMDNEAVSQVQVSKEIGISNSALSQYLKGAYKGDNQAVEKKISQWLEARKMKADIAGYMPAAPEYIETPTAKKITSALQYGHTGALVVICGNPGVGKTFCMKLYADNNPNVWVVTMSPTKKGVTAALEEIALTLGMRVFIMRAAYLEREIIKRLEGTKGLLIIDEADHLRPAALETIRAIREATGTGVVLSGNEEIYSQMTGGPGTRVPAFARLYARIGRRLRLNKPLKEDLTAMAEAFGVTGKKEHQFIIEIGQKPGGLHGLIETLRLSATVARDQEITLPFLKMAWHNLTSDA